MLCGRPHWGAWRKKLKTEEEIKRIRQFILDGKIEKAKKNWSGADVVIDNKAHEPVSNSFYPEPRYVISEFSYEISWLFEKIKDAFYAENLLDGCSKIEFFGRLANSVNEKINKINDVPKQELCITILNEAEKIYFEIINGTFCSLPIAEGNTIADDYRRGK